MEYYYFHYNLGGEPQDMFPGPRIVCLPFGNISHPEDVAEGPYLSIAQLRRESNGFKELHKTNQKRAQKICQRKFIIEVASTVAIPLSIDPLFIRNTYRILQHSANGRVSRDNVSGIHLYDPEKMNIIELVREDDNGVFEARIEVKNPNTGKMVIKESLTTFFPRDWNMQLLIMDIYPAYLNKTLVSHGVYRGLSQSDIIIEFIIAKDDSIVTLYPIINSYYREL